mmetsp:Transcript_31576/g.72608  ORF Transcript_31576/g.72608 Transcript_31576/m.72608 type:complete len:98 (-) Transcript_31576:192-485(-)
MFTYFLPPKYKSFYRQICNSYPDIPSFGALFAVRGALNEVILGRVANACTGILRHAFNKHIADLVAVSHHVGAQYGGNYGVVPRLVVLERCRRRFLR